MSALSRLRRAVHTLWYAARMGALRQAEHDPVRTVVILPRPDDGWRALVETRHRPTFELLAASRRMTPAAYRASLNDWLRHHVASAEVRIRMKPRLLTEFLRVGRYVTQFEVGHSGGVHNPSVRMLLERGLFQVPFTARPEDRPIYGYLSGSDEAGTIQQYGEVVLRLLPNVANRSTFVLGDSLDHALVVFRQPVFAPTPVVAPSALSVAPFVPPAPAPHGAQLPLDPRDVLKARSLGAAALPHGYAEAQIFGGIRPGDVAQVVYTLGAKPDPATSELLSRLRVDWDSIPDLAP